ncbi:hypothetical protein MRB53_040756 [Persea americana]|nr:hypothetical protein MRB53_040756 [Persea americana]
MTPPSQPPQNSHAIHSGGAGVAARPAMESVLAFFLRADRDSPVMAAGFSSAEAAMSVDLMGIKVECVLGAFRGNGKIVAGLMSSRQWSAKPSMGEQWDRNDDCPGDRMSFQPQRAGEAQRRYGVDATAPRLSKRQRRPPKVLDEDVYSEALSHIIARDFFPGLHETGAQEEYMDALDSGDNVWIRSAGRRLTQAMTPLPEAHRRSGTGTRFSTRASTFASATPRTFVGNTPQRGTPTISNPKSRDLPDVGSGHVAVHVPSPDLDVRPASVDSFPDRHGPRNHFMFQPDGVEDQVVTRTQQAELASNAPPRMVKYAATRFPVMSADSDSLTAPSPSLSAIDAAIAGHPRATRSEASYSGAETPRVNGYAFVDAEPTQVK